jgi:MoaA/NifB/PqqE/SkfB family radical SAM enzyme
MNAAAKASIGARILGARLTGRPRPFFVQYSLLNACTSRCAYCNCPKREDPQLSTEEHRRLLAGFARLGAVRIKFLGGEPLLRRDLGDLVAEVRKLGMRSAMVTDGLLIPQNLDVVRELDEVVISLDGNEQRHDAQRGRGTWRRVMRAVELCASERLDFFLTAVVTKNSAEDIDWLIGTARRLGVMINFQIPQINEEMYGRGVRDWIPEPEAIRAILRKIIAAKEAGAPVLFSTRSYRQTLCWDDYACERIDRQGRKTRCTAGRYFVQVEPNGDVYPCVLHIGTFAPGNALRDGVEAAWRRAQEHSCGACYNTWLNENRAIFDLRPAVLMNFWHNYLRPGAPGTR